MRFHRPLPHTGDGGADTPKAPIPNDRRVFIIGRKIGVVSWFASAHLSALVLHPWVLQHESDIPDGGPAATSRRQTARGARGAGGVDALLPTDLGNVDLGTLVECCESEFGGAPAADGRLW